MQNYSADDYYRATLYDRDGDKVGQVQQVYLNDETGEPSWVTVQTGFFGTNESLVPLDGAQMNDDVLRVPFDKRTIKDAPNFDPGHHLDEAEEQDLYRYYGMGGGAGAGSQDRGRDLGVAGAGAAGVAAAGRRDDRREDRDYAGDRDRDFDRDRDLDRDQDRDLGRDDRTGMPEGEPIVQERQMDPARRQDSDEFSDGRDDARGSGLGQDADRRDDRDDRQERELLDRERELLERERDLLNRDRQLLEREQGSRPRLRRHQRNQ